MCELFALSSKLPATVNFSLDILANHGGSSGPHKDGWGIAYYQEGDVRLLKDTGAASESAWVPFIEQQGLSSNTVISHIRKASLGVKALRNTQPFARELGGQMHIFAHNGHLAEIHHRSQFSLATHRPIGNTDSEFAFCSLLARLSPLWLKTLCVPSLQDRLDVITAFATELRALGPANFLYADGDAVFAHSHKATHSNKQFEPFGLYSLCRQCLGKAEPLECTGVNIASTPQTVVLLATVPLTAEAWTPLPLGELIAVRNGHIEGRGLALS